MLLAFVCHVNIQCLIVMCLLWPTGVKSTQLVLNSFEEQAEGMDVGLACSDKAEQEHIFMPGDNVEVIEGEFINLQGTIVKKDGTKITITPKHEDLKVSYHQYSANPAVLVSVTA